MSNETSPLLPAAAGGLTKRGGNQLEKNPSGSVEKWARGEATLKELKAYSAEELYHVAQHGYTLYLNGKFRDAQVIFEGLVAIDPRSDYYYRALGVVYHRRGDAERAIRQFSHAIKVNPRSPAAYVNRAEVHISRRDFPSAVQDLERALRSGAPTHPVVRKAGALRTLLLRRG